MTARHQRIPPSVMNRPRSAGAAALAAFAAVTGFAGCARSRSAASRSRIPVSQVSQQYLAAVEPANAAVAAYLSQALGYIGGSTTSLDTRARTTASVVTGAAHRLNNIAAPDLLQHDISDVAAALTTVNVDLSALAAAAGPAVAPDIARLVADAGQETAADNLVRLTITAASSPTTPPPTVLPAFAATTTTLPVFTPQATTTTATTTTTIARPTTTTRPRQTTTVAPVTTTTSPSTTTVPPSTTSTTRPKTTTTNPLLHL